MAEQRPSLETVRARIDAIDEDLLALLDERAALASAVAEAKRAEGRGDQFGLRPEREAAIVRRLLARPRRAATPALVLRLWRELMAESLRLQGPFNLSVWGGRDPARATELARLRFGAAPSLRLTTRPEEAIAGARELGGVGVALLEPGANWWGRLLARPDLRIVAALPDDRQGRPRALMVSGQTPGPTGDDRSFWVTDAAWPDSRIVETLSQAGLAAEPLAARGGLKLFTLAGYVQADDGRLKSAPGRLNGVIGAAPIF